MGAGGPAAPDEGGARLSRRLLARGRRLIAAGMAVRVLGMAVGLGGTAVLRDSAQSFPFPAPLHAGWWLCELGGLTALGYGLVIFTVGRLTIVRGKQYAQRIATPEAWLDSRYLLYLRPFWLDARLAALPPDVTGGGGAAGPVFFASGLTYEESLVRRFQPYGRVVAIGRPGECLPLPGASRAYLPDEGWQPAVSGLIAAAHAVLLSVGSGPSTVWEYTEALRLLPPERLVLLVCCGPEEYADFRAAVAAEYTRRSLLEPGDPVTGAWPDLPPLPDYPPPVRPQRSRWEVLLNGGRRRLEWDYVLKGVILLAADRTPAFRRVDPTALRLVSAVGLRRLASRELEPVMEQLNELSQRQ